MRDLTFKLLKGKIKGKPCFAMKCDRLPASLDENKTVGLLLCASVSADTSKEIVINKNRILAYLPG